MLRKCFFSGAGLEEEEAGLSGGARSLKVRELPKNLLAICIFGAAGCLTSQIPNRVEESAKRFQASIFTLEKVSHKLAFKVQLRSHSWSNVHLYVCLSGCLPTLVFLIFRQSFKGGNSFGCSVQRQHIEPGISLMNLPCRTHPLQGHVEILTSPSPSLGLFVFVLPEK
jgi:hypothetical protein